MYSLDAILLGLIEYAKAELGLDPRNENAARNALLCIAGKESLADAEPAVFSSPDEAEDALAEYCVKNGLIEEWERETLSDRVMGVLSRSPAEINTEFKAKLLKGGKTATDWLYSYCVKNGYVKRAKLDKNPRFDVGGLVVTINKSKPEFRDPNKAKAGNSVAGGYPKCVICRENEGYAPRNKRTLRTVDIRLGGEDFFWQYSPYGYFNEHGIAVNTKHIPMYVDRTTFYKLMDFVDMFPHYFIGCNAALPRIGGSVLAHDHYQGGGEILPLHKAGIKKRIKLPGRKAETGVLDWPGSVIRIVSRDRNEIADISEVIRAAWEEYDAPEIGIVAKDREGVHNAVSPTVVKKGNTYEMNIILRSNITSEKYPEGVFHAHPEFHTVKKESIGLIEAQGLFILPGRLESELKEVEECVKRGALSPELEGFRLVYDEVRAMGGDVHEAVKAELGSICNRILQNTAVFKTEEAFDAFLRSAGFDL